MLPNFDQSNNSALLSNPANMQGVQGLLMNGTPQGVDIDELLKVLTIIQTSSNLKGLESIIEQYIHKVNDKNFAVKLQGLLNAFKYNNEIVSTNVEMPHLNMKTPKEIAKDLYEELINYKKIKESTQIKTSQTEKLIHKKKKRGNPFRVLMGKIGKLLNHGLNKKQIVRYLSKQDHWSPDTIEKAIEIVKNYSVKNHKKSVEASIKLINSDNLETKTYHLNNEILSTADLMFRMEFIENLLDGVDLGFAPENPKKELKVIKKILKTRGAL